MSTKKPQDEQNKSLMYHIKGVAKCLWKWFEKMPLFVSLALILLAMNILLFNIINMLLQAIAPQLNFLNTMLSIIVSAIIIAQSLNEKKKNE
jgi:uncharacterized membrane protein (DUF106 family)